MKDIFTGLYNKVIGFFQADRAENSKETATNRLKLVLLHDRTNLDTITMQKLREQLIEVISKYIEIDNEALDLSLEGEGDSIALMLNIPVVKARTACYQKVPALFPAVSYGTGSYMTMEIFFLNVQLNTYQ